MRYGAWSVVRYGSGMGPRYGVRYREVWGEDWGDIRRNEHQQGVSTSIAGVAVGQLLRSGRRQAVHDKPT